MKNILLKISAWGILGFASFISLGVLSLIFFLGIYIKEVNPGKLIVLDLGIVIIAIIIFLLGFGLFELLLSFQRVEGEVAETRKEIEDLEHLVTGTKDGNQPPSQSGQTQPGQSFQSPQSPQQPPKIPRKEGERK